MGTNKNVFICIALIFFIFACTKNDDFQIENGAANGLTNPTNTTSNLVSTGPEMVTFTPIPPVNAVTGELPWAPMPFEWTNGHFCPFQGDYIETPAILKPNFGSMGFIDDGYVYFDFIGNSYYPEGYPTAITWHVENDNSGFVELENPSSLDLKLPTLDGLTTCTATLTYPDGEITIEFCFNIFLSLNNRTDSYQITAEVCPESDDIIAEIPSVYAQYQANPALIMGNAFFFEDFYIVEIEEEADLEDPFVSFIIHEIDDPGLINTLYFEYIGNQSFSGGLPTEITWSGYREFCDNCFQLPIDIVDPHSFDLYFPLYSGTYHISANVLFESGQEETIDFSVNAHFVSGEGVVYSISDGDDGTITMGIPGGGGSLLNVTFL